MALSYCVGLNHVDDHIKNYRYSIFSVAVLDCHYTRLTQVTYVPCLISFIYQQIMFSLLDFLILISLFPSLSQSLTLFLISQAPVSGSYWASKFAASSGGLCRHLHKESESDDVWECNHSKSI